MDGTILETFTEICQEIDDFSPIFDGLHTGIVQAAQEAHRDSLLSTEDGSTFMAWSATLLKQKAILKDMSEGLKGAKTKVTGDEVNVDITETYTEIVNEREEKRNNNGPESDDTQARLRNVIQNLGTSRNRTEQVLEGANNISVVMDDESSEVNRKCPITLKPIVSAYRNKKCHHVFERAAVINYIRDMKRNRTALRCPNIGCANNKQFEEKDFEDDPTFPRSTQEF